MQGTLGDVHDKATEYFKETREMARIQNISSQQSLDKMLLLLITGVFVLSVNVVFNQKIDFIFGSFLIIAWILLSVAIISQISGYIYATLQTEYQIEKIDEWHDGWKNRLILYSDPDFIPPRLYSKHIKYSNYCAITSFIVALIFILSFSIVNFFHMTKNSDSKEKASQSNPASFSLPQPENNPQQSDVNENQSNQTTESPEK